MALSSPYNILVPVIRSEVGDLLPSPDQVFTDEDIIKEINEAVKTRVNLDWGSQYEVSDDALDPNITRDKLFVSATVLVSSMRLLNIRKQIAIRQNIGIAKGSTRINVDTLVKSFMKATEELEHRYNQLKISGFAGIVHIPEE